MKKLIYLIALLFLLCGCATRAKQFRDGREYAEYDILFDKDKGRFYIPLQWVGQYQEKREGRRQ